VLTSTYAAAIAASHATASIAMHTILQQHRLRYCYTQYALYGTECSSVYSKLYVYVYVRSHLLVTLQLVSVNASPAATDDSWQHASHNEGCEVHEELCNLCLKGAVASDTIDDRHQQQYIARNSLQVVGSLIKCVDSVPYSRKMTTKASEANALVEQQLHSALVPTQHL
jgi:hypothetical protein